MWYIARLRGQVDEVVDVMKANVSRVVERGDRLEDLQDKSGTKVKLGAQWLSGRVLDSRQRGPGFEPHRRHCVVALEQDTFILA